MTRFALGAKFGNGDIELEIEGVVSLARVAPAPLFRIEAKAIEPMPVEAFPNNCLRVGISERSSAVVMAFGVMANFG